MRTEKRIPAALVNAQLRRAGCPVDAEQSLVTFDHVPDDNNPTPPSMLIQQGPEGQPVEVPFGSGGLSGVGLSNAYAKGITESDQPAQYMHRGPQPLGRVPARAVLEWMLEELIETANAAGIAIVPKVDQDGAMQSFVLGNDRTMQETDLVDFVDGCCDVIYTATGALLAAGVPDRAVLRIVCRANEAKFPKGVATYKNGKYQKPEGWQPPEPQLRAYLNELRAEHGLPPLKE